MWWGAYTCKHFKYKLLQPVCLHKAAFVQSTMVSLSAVGAATAPRLLRCICTTPQAAAQDQKLPLPFHLSDGCVSDAAAASEHMRVCARAIVFLGALQLHARLEGVAAAATAARMRLTAPAAAATPVPVHQCPKTRKTHPPRLRCHGLRARPPQA